MTGKLITIRETAQVCGVSEKTVQRWAKKGMLPIVRFGRTVRVDEQTLREWIAGGGQSQSGAVAN